LKNKTYCAIFMAFLTMGTIAAFAPAVSATVNLDIQSGTTKVTDGPYNLYHTAWSKVRNVGSTTCQDDFCTHWALDGDWDIIPGYRRYLNFAAGGSFWPAGTFAWDTEGDYLITAHTDHHYEVDEWDGDNWDYLNWGYP
jgi:hypothetical protein